MREKEKMMKKLLIFMLVLGMASIANATITFEFRDAAGTSVISDIDVAVGSFTFVVSGLASDAPAGGVTMGVFTPDGADGGGVYDVDGVVDSLGGSTYASAGDVGGATYYSAWDGVDVTFGDVDGATAPNPSSGVWFVIQMSLNPSAVPSNTVQVDWYTYSPSTAIVSSHTLSVVPEPATMALLGLGGLLLLRRRK